MMLNKIIKSSLLGLALIALLLSPSQAFARSKLIDGQHHYYTVQMRSDNRAIVYAKMVFINTDKQDKNEYQFSIPDNIKLKDFSIQQISHKKPICVTPIDYREWKKEHRYGDYDDYKRQKPCNQYSDEGEIDHDYDFKNNTRFYYYGWYYDDDKNNYDYDDLQFERSNNIYVVKLAHPIKPGKQGAVYVSYYTDGYIKSNLGWYDYQFKNFKVDQMIEQADVAINFGQDVYARTTSKIDLNLPETDSKAGITNEALADSYQSDSQDRRHNQAGSGGYIQKSFNDMLPEDVMSVKGKFVDAAWKLYLKEILITIAIIVLLIGGGWFISKKLKDRKKKQTSTEKVLVDNNEVIIERDADVEELSWLKITVINWIVMVLSFVFLLPISYITSQDIYYNDNMLMTVIKTALLMWIIAFVMVMIAELVLFLFKVSTEEPKNRIFRGTRILILSQFLTMVVVFIITFMLSNNFRS